MAVIGEAILNLDRPVSDVFSWCYNFVPTIGSTVWQFGYPAKGCISTARFRDVYEGYQRRSRPMESDAAGTCSTVIASGVDRTRDTGAGIILNNMAALLSASGRIAEAERLADRSVSILEQIYPPNDVLSRHAVFC